MFKGEVKELSLSKLKILACSFIILSIAIMMYSISVLSLYISNAPGPGFFPFLLGIALMCLSLIMFFSSDSNNNMVLWADKGWVRPLQAIFLFIFFAVTFERLGCIIAIFVFSFIWQCLIEHRKVLYSTIISLTTSIFVYVLFVVLLKVPFPIGILSVLSKR